MEDFYSFDFLHSGLFYLASVLLVSFGLFPFFDAGMHSSSQLSADLILYLFTPAFGSLMRMLTKSGPAAKLYVMLPESASPFYMLLFSITLCCGLFASSQYIWELSL